jgi:hypothetical protein
MGLNFDPIDVFAVDDRRLYIEQGSSGEESLQLGGIDISAHRLFGPQPRAATYLCIWELWLGSITGSVRPPTVLALQRAMASFKFGFGDADNTLPRDMTALTVPDVTLVSLKVDRLDVSIPLDATCVVKAEMPKGVNVQLDDIPRDQFLRHVSVDIPLLSARCMVLCSVAPSRRHESRGEWLEAAALTLDLLVDD